MQITSPKLINSTPKYLKKIILPAVFATGLTACTNINNNTLTQQANTEVQQTSSDVFEKSKKIEDLKELERQKDAKNFQKAIFQALPYINNGKFKKVEAMENGFILDGKYKLKLLKKIDTIGIGELLSASTSELKEYKKESANIYGGHYSLFDDHSFKMDKLKNGNFNLIYKNDDKIEALAFSKDGKLLSKFEAFKQNSSEPPYELPFKEKFSDVYNFKSSPENTDDKIVKFNNPLSDKELNVFKNLIADKLSDIKIVDTKQDGDALVFKYNTNFADPEGEYTLIVKNTIGLNYERESDSGSDADFSTLKIHTLDNGGYLFYETYGDFFRSNYLTYLDKDLNIKDENWYRQDKAIREKIKKELSAAQMEKALENIKNGKPAQYKLDDCYLILLPKPNEKVVGETSLSTRALTSCENVRNDIENVKNAIENLSPAEKSMIVATTVAVGGIMVEAVMIPTAPLVALGIEGVLFNQTGE